MQESHPFLINFSFSIVRPISHSKSRLEDRMTGECETDKRHNVVIHM